MTCAKVKVRCTIICLDGTVFQGENSCRNPQPRCPRLPGEGYEKCRTICDQFGHAEAVALDYAGKEAFGAIAIVEKHRDVCSACKSLLKAAGIREVILTDGAAIQQEEGLK